LARILILGGGFGGLAAAHRLRERLAAEHEIVLIEKRETFIIGFRKTWMLTGQSTLEEGAGSLTNLAKKGIRWMQSQITSIDPLRLCVTINGDTISGEAMIVALGVELVPEAIPGFERYAHNVYDRQSVIKAAAALRSFQGGRVVIGIFGNPYQCPPAPFEMAILINEHLKKRGSKASVEVFSPLPMSLPVLGDAGCNVIEDRLAAQGIAFLTNHKAKSVEDGQVLFTDGSRRPFDLLLGVAPHRASAVVRQSGLTDGRDWATVNPETLESKFPDVYAIGDCNQILMANGKSLPKAGVFAESQGYVAAERIAAKLGGGEPSEKFSGEGYCFLEVGGGQAVKVQGNFMAQPGPQVTLTEASPQLLEEKLRFEQERLQAWLS
jgi:sulfide:quinone oxidoreductase